MKAKISGIAKTKANFGKIQKQIQINSKNALKLVGEKIGNLASNKVPILNGILKSSFTVIEQNNKILAGYNTEYASYQHQGIRADGSFVIRNRPGGGETYFLTNTVNENRKNLINLYHELSKKTFNQIKL
jgi:hypothetical protein